MMPTHAIPMRQDRATRPSVALRAGAAPRHRRHGRGYSPARAWP